MFIAVMQWDGSDRVTKFQEFATEAEAEAHVAANAGTYPDAFSTARPTDGRSSDWIVNSGAGTVTIDYAGLLTEARAKKHRDLSAILEAKTTPFSYNDGGGAANYRAGGKLLQYMHVLADRIAINGGAGQHILDGTETNWVFAGLYPKTAADLQVFTIAASNGARTDLTHVASGPVAGEYTIASSNPDRLILTLGAAGAAGDTLCVKIGVGNINWVDDSLNKKTWTEQQFQDFVRGLEDHLASCGTRYFQLHNAIEGVTGTDAEKYHKLVDTTDPGYVDLTTGWPSTSVN